MTKTTTADAQTVSHLIAAKTATGTEWATVTGPSQAMDALTLAAEAGCLPATYMVCIGERVEHIARIGHDNDGRPVVTVGA